MKQNPFAPDDAAARARIHRIDDAQGKPSLSGLRLPDGAEVVYIQDPRTGIVYALYNDRIVR